MGRSIAKLAEQIAAAAHDGQVDKAGQPYIAHPARVAARVAGDERAVAAAWLHDVVEDTDVTLADLEQTFPADVTAARRRTDPPPRRGSGRLLRPRPKSPARAGRQTRRPRRQQRPAAPRSARRPHPRPPDRQVRPCPSRTDRRCVGQGTRVAADASITDDSRRSRSTPCAPTRPQGARMSTGPTIRTTLRSACTRTTRTTWPGSSST